MTRTLGASGRQGGISQPRPPTTWPRDGPPASRDVRTSPATSHKRLALPRDATSRGHVSTIRRDANVHALDDGLNTNIENEKEGQRRGSGLRGETMGKKGEGSDA